MGLLTYLAIFVVLICGVHLRSVDSSPKYARYCGPDLASELQRRCRSQGYNGPQQNSPLLFQDKKPQISASIRSKDRDIIEACCHSRCTEAFLDSFCLSSNPEDDITVESETIETTTIVGSKKQLKTKKPKTTRKSGKSEKNRDDESQTENPRKDRQKEKNKNKDKNKKNREERNKCDKKTLKDKNGKPCVRKSKERKEKERSRKTRKRNKKNKPTRRPKRWDSETTTLSDFLLSQKLLQEIYDSDIDDRSIDDITTQFDALPEDDLSSSLSQEESSSNEVIQEAQRTEQFRPPFKPVPADTSEDAYNNNMYVSTGNTRNEQPPLDDDPVEKLKELRHIFAELEGDSTSSS
ncbi:uncharacterized protein [Antedon mediterranea]|uniref:uncharacterized protein n=1 Tax=Antedon mediterranea TaxID=105859 RepID=UPI003AF62ECA